MADNAVTIIKRKKKGGGHGHHGGAWKVAYADFVTAMMAFFLLLWLLGSVSEDTKKGIADYFDERIPITQTSGGGVSAFSGDSLMAKDKLAESGAKTPPESASPPPKTPEQQAAEAAAAAETKALEEIEKAFKSLGGESAEADEMLSHIRTRLTPEGLVIELFEQDGSPLFESDGATPTPMLAALASVVSSVAQLVTNDIAVSGHARGGSQDDTAWDVSADRAEATRRLLGEAGLPQQRVTGVTARAGSQPMVDNPADPRNGRVEITLLRKHPTN